MGPFEPVTLVKDQKSMDNHLNLSLDMGNVNFRRLPCEPGFPDRAPENPCFGQRQGHVGPARGEETANEAFPVESQPKPQELRISTYSLKNYSLSFDSCIQIQADIEGRYTENIKEAAAIEKRLPFKLVRRQE